MAYITDQKGQLIMDYKKVKTMNRDQIIITGIINGDDRILKSFYKDQRKYICSYILKNRGNMEDVEDILQDAILLLYQKLCLGQLEIRVSLNTYFFSVCKNMWRNQLRDKKKMVAPDPQPGHNEEVANILEDYLENKERDFLYQKCFQKLNMEHKKVLELFIEGKSMREIAIETGISEGHSRKRKYDAKKKLFEIFERDPMYHELKLA